MDQQLHAALVAGQGLERQVMRIAEDVRLEPQERGRRISELIAQQTANQASVPDAWATAGRPEPLGFHYNSRADYAEWFDGWFEVETLVLEGEQRGYTRDEMQHMILSNEEPFDQEFEAEDLGVIFRSNEQAHTD
jgi:hypothetical protein